jgi:AraC-like DNA-binding protein
MEPVLPVTLSHIPTGPLKELVYAILYVRGLGAGLALQRVYQNIIINIGDSFHTSSPFENDMPLENPHTVWINGKHQKPFFLGHRGIPAFYVVAVKPGMLPYFTSIPVSETNERALSAEVWGSPSIFALQDQLAASNDIAANFVAIEQYFTDHVKEPTPGTSHKIALLTEALPTHTVAELCDATGYTRKRLWQEVLRHFGAPVKEMQGIIRFHEHLNTLAHDTEENLSALHTFYDQAHFIRDFKSRTGLTPKQYRQLCSRFPDTRRHVNFISIAKETFLQFYRTGLL